MRAILVRIVSVSVALIALTSCATIGPARDGESAGRVLGLLRTGQAEALSAMSDLPFLVDREIVVLQSDVEAFWRTLAESGFTAGDAALSASTPVTETSFREFADTMEVKTFFTKYVVKGSRILVLMTSGRERILLLVHDEPFARRLTIRGIKGPF